MGQENRVLYQPIKDSLGRTIGILYVGVPNQPYRQHAINVAFNMGLFGVLGLLCVVVLSWFFTSYICKPINILAAATKRLGTVISLYGLTSLPVTNWQSWEDNSMICWLCLEK